MSKDLLAMSLKQWVNDKHAMEDFVKHLDDLIFLQHNKLEQSDNMIEVHRAQGAIAALKKLKLLRETVNGGRPKS